MTADIRRTSERHSKADGKGALRLSICQYGLSKLPFRGPMRPTDGRFVAFIGGTETFAKFIQKPFPDRIEAATGEICVNLGCQAAGPDVFVRDMAVQSLCHDAAVTVIQVLGVTNLSNGFYRVHPRRNDRFVAPTDTLVALFPEIDFAEIAFTGHLIEKLRAVDAVRFDLVKLHLQHTWLRRMRTLIAQCGGPVILLRLQHNKADTFPITASIDPAFVTDEMMDSLRPFVRSIVVVPVKTGSTVGMRFAPLEALNAAESLGEAGHAATAKALRGPLMQALV